MSENSLMEFIQETPTVLLELVIDVLHETQTQDNSVAVEQLKCDMTNCIYKKPFEFGWKRELVYRSQNTNEAEVYYITPLAKKLRNKKEIKLHLRDGLDLTMFTLTKYPLGASEEHEIVRSATVKGYRQQDENTDPNLLSGEFIAFKSSAPKEDNVTKPGTNCLQIDKIVSKSLNEQCQSQSKSVEMISKMEDVAQLRQLRDSYACSRCEFFGATITRISI